MSYAFFIELDVSIIYGYTILVHSLLRAAFLVDRPVNTNHILDFYKLNSNSNIMIQLFPPFLIDSWPTGMRCQNNRVHSVHDYFPCTNPPYRIPRLLRKRHRTRSARFHLNCFNRDYYRPTAKLSPPKNSCHCIHAPANHISHTTRHKQIFHVRGTQ